MSDTKILTEDEKTLRNEIISALKRGIVTVHFTKVDGTQRTMRCTLSDAVLPPKPEPDPSNPLPPKSKRPPTNVVVWDTEKEEWRSFNLRSVTAWQPE
jgi:hypothetical protein